MFLITLLATSLAADIGSPIPCGSVPTTQTPIFGEVSYATLLIHVQAGGSGTLFVGVPATTTEGVWCEIPTLDGKTPGVYQCRLIGDTATMQRNLPALPVVPTLNLFQFPVPSDCPTGNCPLR